MRSASGNSNVTPLAFIPALLSPMSLCKSRDAACCRELHPVRASRENFNEQIAVALLRLQRDMASALHRLHTLEELARSQVKEQTVSFANEIEGILLLTQAKRVHKSDLTLHIFFSSKSVKRHHCWYSNYIFFLFFFPFHVAVKVTLTKAERLSTGYTKYLGNLVTYFNKCNTSL